MSTVFFSNTLTEKWNPFSLKTSEKPQLYLDWIPQWDIKWLMLSNLATEQDVLPGLATATFSFPSKKTLLFKEVNEHTNTEVIYLN